MPRIIKYLVTTIFFLFLAVSYPLISIRAETQTDTAPETCSWIGQSMSCFTQVLKKSNEGALNKEGSEFATTNNSINALSIMIGGAWDTSKSGSECPAASLNFQKGALSGIGGSIAAIYNNPPASTNEYARDLGRTLGFLPARANAQGIGFSGLSTLLPLWKVFRDISYGILAIILIVVGLMVMFRKKIDPKTVVTVQNSIPRIVVALLLVTFSYAIVGLLIDGMYLLIALAISMISNSSVGPSIGHALSASSKLCNSTISQGLNTIGSLTGIGHDLDPTWSTKEATDSLFSGGLFGWGRFFFGSGLGAWNDVWSASTGNNPIIKTLSVVVPGIIGAFVGGPKGLAAGLTIFSGPGLLILIILLVLLFGFIRILFMLIDAYINIIIALLTAPFQLVLEAIPGSTSFSSWLRNLISKLIVFPITIMLLLVAAILTSTDSAASIWAPPLLSGSNGSGGYGMAGIIGLGMLLVIPTFVAGIQKSMKAEPAIPGGIGTMFGPLGQGVGSLMNIVYQGSMIKSMLPGKHGASPSHVVRKGSQQGFGTLTGEGQSEEHS